MFDAQRVAEVIRDGLDGDVPSQQIADEILDSMHDGGRLRATSHPLRRRILDTLMVEGPTSPARVARRAGASVGTVSYHFRKLADLGYVEVTERIPRRGAIEHVYALTRPSE